MIRRTYDAMAEREALSQELARWKIAHWRPSAAAWRWHRRVARLARRCRLPVHEVRADLERDAALRLDDEPSE